MRIKVYSRKIKKREIIEFLNLLPDKYKNLDVDIKVYGSRIHLMISQLFSGRKKTKKSMGDFNKFYNSIRCYPYMMDKNKYLKIEILDTILHEIRHKYQSIHYEYRYLYDQANYINGGEGYRDQWIEKDAFRFSRRVMNLYRYEISKIIGFEEEWKIYKS